jgi:hypothetical protein
MAIQHLYGKSDFDRTFETMAGRGNNRTEETPNDNDGDVHARDDEELPEEDEEEKNEEQTPNRCKAKFDAAAVIRGELWVFDGDHFWRVPGGGRARGDRPPSGPVDLGAFWYGLPRDVRRVDAVYERPDHRIVFFSGRSYYVLAGNSRLELGPEPLTRLGLPEELEKVDAALRWGWNGKTYFFAGNS